jgi:beta-glucuronidase
MNNKGIVDEYRRRKLAYDVVKKIYRSYGNYFE